MPCSLVLAVLVSDDIRGKLLLSLSVFKIFFLLFSEVHCVVSSFGFFQLASLFHENIGFSVSLSWNTQHHCIPWGIKRSSDLIAPLVPD